MAGRRPDYPDTVVRFSDASAPGLKARPSFLHGDVTLSADTRDNDRYPNRGGLYQATWSRFGDQRGESSFGRYELEAVYYKPLVPGKWTLAVHGSVVTTQTAPGQRAPFYLLPNLGGRNSRGLRDYRYYDRNLHEYSAELRWALFRHVDSAVFVDAGSVAPSLGRLRLKDLKPSYGVGIRLHGVRSTLARMDVAHSAEGWRLIFKMNDPFRRSSQVAGRPPVVPYVP